MFKISLIRMLIFLTGCKNTLNNEKNGTSKNKNSCIKRKHMCFSQGTSVKPTYSEPYFLESNKKKRAPEEDKMQKFMKSHHETADISMIGIEELIGDNSESISTINSVDEYIQNFDETLLNLEENKSNFCVIQYKNGERKEQISSFNGQTSSYDISNEFHLNDGIRSNNIDLTILKEIIVNLTTKTKRKPHDKRFIINLFPETLAIIRFKIKKGENNDLVELFCHKLIGELSEDIVYRFQSKRAMFKSTIKVRKALILFLTKNRICSDSYISLYKNLVELFKLELLKSKGRDKYKYINIISSLFIAMFLLEEDEVVKLESAIKELIRCTKKLKKKDSPMAALFNNLNMKKIVLEMIEMREICSGLLPIRKDDKITEQAKELESYFNELKKDVRSNPNRQFEVIDIDNFLCAIELYKYTLQGFSFTCATKLIGRLLEKLRTT